jgi:hypothetical protein
MITEYVNTRIEFDNRVWPGVMPGRKRPQTCLRAFCVTPQYAGSAELEPGWLASETARPLWGRIAAPPAA